MSYRVTEVVEPTREAFFDAARAAGIDWPHDDILERHRHPGVRAADGVVSLIVQPARFDEASARVEVVQVAMLLGEEAGVSARWPGDGMDPARAELSADREAFVLQVVEAVYEVDIESITDIEELVDDLEIEVLEAEGENAAPRIYALERQLLDVRRATAPMVDLIDRLLRRASDDAGSGLREWQARYERLVAQVEDVDTLLTSILGVNLTLVTVRQNEDMRKIAAWGAIGIAPTAMAGVWGMNFRHMPELDWTLGYPLAVATIVLVCLGLYRYFRKVGWL